MTKPANPRRRSMRVPVDTQHTGVGGNVVIAIHPDLDLHGEPPSRTVVVQCFGCLHFHPMAMGRDGRSKLPATWSTLWPTDRKDRNEHPDVYAAPPCTDRAAERLSQVSQKGEISVTRFVQVPKPTDLTLAPTEPPPEK